MQHQVHVTPNNAYAMHAKLECFHLPPNYNKCHLEKLDSLEMS